MITKFLTLSYLVGMKVHLKFSSLTLPMSSIYREFLFILIFLAGILSKSFSLIFVYSIFYFLVHYSLILKTAPFILKILLLFSMSSKDGNYTKKLYITSSDLIFENSGKNFSCFEYLLSYCINSLLLNSFELISCF